MTEFVQIGPLAELEPEALHNRASGLKVDIGLFRIETQRSVMGDVLLKRYTAAFSSETPRVLDSQVGHGNGIAALLLEPLDLFHHHGMPDALSLGINPVNTPNGEPVR